MRSRTWTDLQLTQAVATSYSLAQVLRHLNLAIAGGSYVYIRKQIERLNLDTTHFAGASQQGRFGKSKNKSLGEILVIGSPYQSSEIRRFLLAAGLKENRCEQCSIIEWLGQPLTIQLHHINKIRNDHRLENLKMLCPNCHDQM